MAASSSYYWRPLSLMNNSGKHKGVGMSQKVDINEGKSPNIILRFLWFIFIGSWVGLIVITIASLLQASIIGIPLAIFLYDRIPSIMTLKARHRTLEIYEDAKGHLKRRTFGAKQHNILLRIIYFLLIGWWFTGVWIGAAMVVSISIIGIPLAFWMVDRIPYVSSLAKI
jgi:uncharacterized membrane protein YccF (DUF307 family)